MEQKKTKVCPMCGRELPIEQFAKDKNSKDGYQEACRECKSKHYAAVKKYGGAKLKWCYQCKDYYPADYFDDYNRHRKRDSLCRNCVKQNEEAKRAAQPQPKQGELFATAQMPEMEMMKQLFTEFMVSAIEFINRQKSNNYGRT